VAVFAFLVMSFPLLGLLKDKDKTRNILYNTFSLITLIILYTSLVFVFVETIGNVVLGINYHNDNTVGFTNQDFVGVFIQPCVLILFLGIMFFPNKIFFRKLHGV
jgi:hypothetical protein